MMANASDVKTPSAPAAFQPASGWQIVWGVLLIITGALAVLMPVVAALATALVFGWLLMLGGISEIVYAFHARAQGHFGWKLVSGILTLVLGIAVWILPGAGAASLALLVGAFLFVGGVVRTVLAFRFRPRRGWGWVLFDGLLSVVLAGLIAGGWPESSIAFIGLLTGFVLISAGVWRIVLHQLAAAA
jgi:uncharacterized membrane protein HdeD (DUF308 family)